MKYTLMASRNKTQPIVLRRSSSVHLRSPKLRCHRVYLLTRLHQCPRQNQFSQSVKCRETRSLLVKVTFVSQQWTYRVIDLKLISKLQVKRMILRWLEKSRWIFSTLSNLRWKKNRKQLPFGPFHLCLPMEKLRGMADNRNIKVNKEMTLRSSLYSIILKVMPLKIQEYRKLKRISFNRERLTHFLSRSLKMKSWMDMMTLRTFQSKIEKTAKSECTYRATSKRNTYKMLRK